MSNFSVYVYNKSTQTQTQVQNITSMAEVDVPYYDGDITSNDFDASFMGAPWTPDAVPTSNAPMYVSDQYQNALYNATGGSSGKNTPPQPVQKKITQIQFTCTDGSSPFFNLDEVQVSNGPFTRL